MSVSAVTSSPSELWPLLQQSRADQSASANAASADPFGSAQGAASTSSSIGTTTSTATGTSAAANQIIADLQSFFLSLQADGPATGPATEAVGGSGPTDATTATAGAQPATPHLHHGHGHHGGGGGGPDPIAQLLQQYAAQADSAAAPSTAIDA